MACAWRPAFSTQTTWAAPRLRHSRLKAPVPAKSSNTRAPTTRSPRLLKTACFTKSGVGRTASPLGTRKIRPEAWPPVILMGTLSQQSPALVSKTCMSWIRLPAERGIQRNERDDDKARNRGEQHPDEEMLVTDEVLQPAADHAGH